jgi:glycine cleavage system H protein
MKKYTKSHEWIEITEENAVIGITQHAQELLGDVVYADLPAIGKSVKKGEILCSLESVKAAAEVFSPISGVVTEVNETLGETPELINQSAENEGWIVKIKLSNASEIEDLMDEAAYQRFCRPH